MAFPWTPITSIEQLETILNQQRIAVLFKHSTRCIVSKTALKQFEKNHQTPTEKVGFYFLDLIKHRNISLAVAEKTNILHQSPQLIIWHNGTVLHHANHNEIINVAVADCLS